MKYLHKLIILVFILFSLNSFAQDDKKYSRVLTYSQMMEEMINCKEEKYVLEDAKVIMDNYKHTDSITIINHSIVIKNVDFFLTSGGSYLFFNNYIFEKYISFYKIAVYPHKNYFGDTPGIGFNDCTFKNHFTLGTKNSCSIYLNNCSTYDYFWIRVLDNNSSSISISNSTFHLNKIGICDSNKKSLRSIAFTLNKNTTLEISHSTFIADTSQSWFQIFGEVSELILDSCIFNANVTLKKLNIINRLTIVNNKISNTFDLSETRFPNSNVVDLRWAQFNKPLVMLEYEFTHCNNMMSNDALNYLYTGHTLEQASNTIKYYQLTATYKTLLNIYKDRGDLESQNACYVAMKDMETVRLEYLYRSNKNVETYLYWKLNVFLKFFAKYGTSPVRSVMVSMWVILAFSVIYFFLYSEWDRIDRKFLISKHRKLLEYFSSEQKLEDFYAEQYKDDFEEYETYKNDLETSKAGVPFLIRVLGKPLYYSSLFKHNVMTWLYNKSEILQGKWIDLTTSRKLYVGFVVGISVLLYISYLIIIRLLNSLMLSVNTFSTLGFGNIPVQGGARYIAILEGFIGWFLLSIFSVALISQILQG